MHGGFQFLIDVVIYEVSIHNGFGCKQSQYVNANKLSQTRDDSETNNLMIENANN